MFPCGGGFCIEGGGYDFRGPSKRSTMDCALAMFDAAPGSLIDTDVRVYSSEPVVPPVGGV